MKIIVLASGSEGNVTYIETEKHKILFDLGMRVKYIKEQLKEINVKLEEIDYVFISHTHSDHISGLANFIKRFQPTVCISLPMFAEIDNLKDYEHVIIYEDEVVLDDIQIEAVRTSHDAVDSRGFVATSNGESVVYLTDTGYIHQKNFRKLANKDYYLFESNHDTQKLMNGSYPKWLKMRIFSANGHLSNKDAGIYLTKLIGKKTKKIVLMHLSKNNNTEELALSTVKETFINHDIEFDDITCAKQKERLVVKV